MSRLANCPDFIKEAAVVADGPELVRALRECWDTPLGQVLAAAIAKHERDMAQGSTVDRLCETYGPEVLA